MRALVIATLLFFSAAVFAEESEVSRLRWSVGTGVEARAQQEVNPEYYEVQTLPQLFAQFRLHPWTATVETGYEQRETNAGALLITSRSFNLGVWGRYEFREPLRWSPFLAGGVGAYFDTVGSQFATSHDERHGQRKYIGVGGGMAHAFWTHFLTEAEIRTALVEDRADVAWSFIVRVGYIL